MEALELRVVAKFDGAEAAWYLERLFFQKCCLIKKWTWAGPQELEKEILSFKIWNFRSWSWPDLGSNVKMSATIELYAPNDL